MKKLFIAFLLSLLSVSVFSQTIERTYYDGNEERKILIRYDSSKITSIEIEIDREEQMVFPDCQINDVYQAFKNLSQKFDEWCNTAKQNHVETFSKSIPISFPKIYCTWVPSLLETGLDKYDFTDVYDESIRGFYRDKRFYNLSGEEIRFKSDVGDYLNFKFMVIDYSDMYVIPVRYIKGTCPSFSHEGATEIFWKMYSADLKSLLQALEPSSIEKEITHLIQRGEEIKKKEEEKYNLFQ